MTAADGGAADGRASFAYGDKILVLENPEADLDCNFSIIVQCGKNLGSWQGEILGFPNPILGLGGKRYAQLRELRAALAADGITSEIVDVDYEFFAGADSMLVLKRAV